MTKDDVPNLGQRTMEDKRWHILGSLHKLVYARVEATGWRVMRASDVASCVVVVTDIHHAVVLHGLLIALDNCRELLMTRMYHQSQTRTDSERIRTSGAMYLIGIV